MRLAREQFPVLTECVYLNSCSTGASPSKMKECLERHWDVLARFRDELWEGWLSELSAFVTSLEDLLGAPAGSVVTDVNSSSLLSRFLTSIDFSGERCRIVTTSLDFPNIEFIARAFRRFGAQVVVVEPEPGSGRIDEDLLAAAMDERTAVVCTSHATFSTGALLDVGAVVRRAREVGAMVAVDAYQSVGIVPVNVQAMDVDVLVGGAKKWLCGAADLGFMYVRPELVHVLEPVATGWFAGKEPMTFAPQEQFAEGARRFASGTPAILPALLSRAGLDVVRYVGVDDIRGASLSMTDRIFEWADRLGLGARTPREHSRRGGAVVLTFPGDGAATRELLRRSFIVSYRGGLRISPHFYNTEDVIEELMEELSKILRLERR